MRYVHTMVRVSNLDESLKFFCDIFGMVETHRYDSAAGKFTNVFLAAPKDLEAVKASRAPELELTYNWDSDEVYKTGRAWGHLAFRVDNIYETCQRLIDNGVTVNRPPRDGRMAFFKTPDGVSIELLQEGDALEVKEPWASMKNDGTW